MASCVRRAKPSTRLFQQRLYQRRRVQRVWRNIHRRLLPLRPALLRLLPRQVLHGEVPDPSFRPGAPACAPARPGLAPPPAVRPRPAAGGCGVLPVPAAGCRRRRELPGAGLRPPLLRRLDRGAKGAHLCCDGSAGAGPGLAAGRSKESAHLRETQGNSEEGDPHVGGT